MHLGLALVFTRKYELNKRLKEIADLQKELADCKKLIRGLLLFVMKMLLASGRRF